MRLFFNIKGEEVEPEFTKMKFPAGETHVKLPILYEVDEILIKVLVKNGDDVMQLLLTTDALRRNYKAPISLFLPYIPYSRQDRPMIPGEPFSLKVFANLINSQNYEKVICCDPHSDVSAALIDRLEVLEPFYLKEIKEDFVLIAPDGGALKKIYKQAEYLNYEGEILCANKVRDLKTGKIIRTEVQAPNEKIQGKTILILDDICSYGGTFMALAEVLKDKGAAKVILAVTHYENVADVEKLKKHIDKIYTTDSMGPVDNDFITQIKL